MGGYLQFWITKAMRYSQVQFEPARFLFKTTRTYFNSWYKTWGKGKDAHAPTWVFSTSSRHPLMFSLGSYALNLSNWGLVWDCRDLTYGYRPWRTPLSSSPIPFETSTQTVGELWFCWGNHVDFPSPAGVWREWEGHVTDGAMMWKWGMVTEGCMDFLWGVQNCPRIASPWVGRNWMHFGLGPIWRPLNIRLWRKNLRSIYVVHL